jgi:hypothetical protein
VTVLPRYMPTTVEISDEAGDSTHDVVLDRETGSVIPAPNVVDAIQLAELVNAGVRSFDEFPSITPAGLDALGIKR